MAYHVGPALVKTDLEQKIDQLPTSATCRASGIGMPKGNPLGESATDRCFYYEFKKTSSGVELTMKREDSKSTVCDPVEVAKVTRTYRFNHQLSLSTITDTGWYQTACSPKHQCLQTTETHYARDLGRFATRRAMRMLDTAVDTLLKAQSENTLWGASLPPRE
jgi:hypothetical protein